MCDDLRFSDLVRPLPIGVAVALHTTDGQKLFGVKAKAGFKAPRGRINKYRNLAMKIIKNNILRIGFNFLNRKQGEGVADDPNGSHRVYDSTEQCQKNGFLLTEYQFCIVSSVFTEITGPATLPPVARLRCYT